MDIKRYASTIGLLLFVDSFWLLTGGQYAVRMTEQIQNSPVIFRYGAAAIVYIALAYLITFAKSAIDAFSIGVCTYAVYDFTNYAILKGYDWRFAVADTLWGGILMGLVYLAVKGMGFS